MEEELHHLNLLDLADRIANRSLTSKALVQYYLDRIEQVNPQLNAVVSLQAEHALKLAAKADEDLKNGTLYGPLHGIPMTIKDSLDTFDMVTTWGTEGRREFRPGKDATCVKRLRDAGAILLGKTNTPEFTLSFQTDNNLFGPTRNPFNPDHTPGGSSGGAAALIAAGATLFDVGTDTGGSIRLPSHFCGIAGIKPTSGRVPCTGNALPSAGLIARLSQPGPMGRNIADLTLLLELMSGPDFEDTYAVDAPWRDPAQVDVSQLRIGYHTDNGIKTPQREIGAALEQVAGILRQLGFDPIEARPPGIEMTNFILARVFGADGGDLVEMLLEDSRTQNPSSKLRESIDNPVLEIDQREFAQVITLWDNYRSSMLGYFRDFDILVCPVNGRTALPLGETEDLANYTYTSAFNLTGWPGVVIRAGTDDNGLPIGVQILARPFREDHCLALAAKLEPKLGPFAAPAVVAG